ncbi:putative Zn-dependent protease [Wenyingzhuangia heitensis]|uniref:Zn-dependent protease n=1 Tax=Wenyingzhuangia heitensis TaxID=1487859 RepID=A0ABX0UBE5_9FLAO|nr:M48 family metallopeptidase [Wenyingzhuangia heitensis]NIJ46154.1 putative Zn-dependent protease [Wenyingzhuangia heitensis]
MNKIISSILIATFLTACSTVPITGRKRLNFVSDATVLPTSFSQYNTFLKENKISTNVSKTQEIKQIGGRISKAVDKFMRANGMSSEADSYRWEFNLVEDEQLNAWCMPGGKVVFYTGILPVAKNTDGIAAIMGHEVAHAFAKHGQERMSSSQIQQYAGAAVAIGTSTQDEKTQQMWNMAYGLGSQLGMLKYSRTHETEADKLGLVFMIMAGYRGEEAVAVWQRMKSLGGSSQPEFLSTHPSNDSRIATLQSYLPEAKRLAAKYK